MYAPCTPLRSVDPRGLIRTANHVEWSLKCNTYYHTPPAPSPDHLQYLSDQCPIMFSKPPCVLQAAFLSRLEIKKLKINQTFLAVLQSKVDDDKINLAGQR